MSEHPDLAFLSVAADIGGVDAARPFHEQAGATFPTVADADNLLGRLFDYKIIPNGLFVDETGVVQGIWIGFSVDRPECVQMVDRFLAGEMEPFVNTPQGPVGAPGVAPGETPAAPPRSSVEQELYETRVRLGAALRAAGRQEEALAEWQKALRMDPENFVLRKQIWMLRYPERFHPTIDFPWQKEQLARERAEEAAERAAECGPDGCALPPA
ncbi:MAG: thioredoxin family protein [Bacillota bacterium]